MDAYVSFQTLRWPTFRSEISTTANSNSRNGFSFSNRSECSLIYKDYENTFTQNHSPSLAQSSFLLQRASLFNVKRRSLIREQNWIWPATLMNLTMPSRRIQKNYLKKARRYFALRLVKELSMCFCDFLHAVLVLGV